jgi:hypothetical protein
MLWDGGLMIHLRHYKTHETLSLELPAVLELINRDRSDEWLDYNETDWKEGLDLTDYELIRE